MCWEAVSLITGYLLVNVDADLGLLYFNNLALIRISYQNMAREHGSCSFLLLLLTSLDMISPVLRLPVSKSLGETQAGTSYLKFMEDCCRSHGNRKELSFSEHSPLIKEKYLSHIKDLYITITCSYPSLCMGENVSIAYNQSTTSF